jgi:hypothetical protein
MTKTKKPNYLPDEIAKNLTEYMRACGYAEGTINMRLGNLNFLFSHYGDPKMMLMLHSDHERVWEHVQHIETTLPPGCLVNADTNSFKLAWESIHGIEITNKRVKKEKPLNEDTTEESTEA